MYNLWLLGRAKARKSRRLVITEGTAKIQMTTIVGMNVGGLHISSSRDWQASTPTIKRIPGGFHLSRPRKGRR
jgi:hypothetical protein